MIRIEYIASDRLLFTELAPSEDIARAKARRTSKVKRFSVDYVKFTDGKGREIFVRRK
jgi:hypothetical protein